MAATRDRKRRDGLYNVLNSAPALTYNQNFVLPTATGPTGSWLTANVGAAAAVRKFSAQIDF